MRLLGASLQVVHTLLLTPALRGALRCAFEGTAAGEEGAARETHAGEEGAAGASRVVLARRTLLAAGIESVAPLGAALERKMVSVMTTLSGPAVVAAPPVPELASN